MSVSDPPRSAGPGPDEESPAIDIDMAAARALHRDWLRRRRQPLIAALDIDWLRAAERDDESGRNRVAAAKQRLRDVTQDRRIAAAASPEELRLLDLERLIS
jgi:hypothetical protein